MQRGLLQDSYDNRYMFCTQITSVGTVRKYGLRSKRRSPHNNISPAYMYKCHLSVEGLFTSVGTQM